MRGTFDCPLRVGQRVRHTDYKGQRVTGVVYGLSIDSEQGLMVDCVLDEPIVMPATAYCEEVKLYRQYAQAHEFTAFDERDELVEELTKALDILRDCLENSIELLGHDPADDARVKLARAAIAKATGSAA